MQLIIFTYSYPYDFSPEYTFIDPEIGFLAKKFSRITLVPRVSGENKRPLPVNVSVDNTYANLLHKNLHAGMMIRTAFSSQLVKNELRKRTDIWLAPAKVLKLILFVSRVQLTRDWATKFVRDRQLDPRKCLFYSYWTDHAATGLAMLKSDIPGLKVVSRAHGFDIFEEYYYPHYWPYREETLKLLDMLFIASDSARKYLCEQYPAFTSKFETAHLGITDRAIVGRPSQDGIFRIVSCSSIVPVKRLPLLADGVIAAARRRPLQKIEWTHFGDGKWRKSLERHMRRNRASNVETHLLGYVPNQKILEFYRDHAVDVFVNVSKTEGGAPVSIQEAISCGIPVVATSIGGNPEIVSEKNGILLPANPKPEEIATALLKIWDNPLLAARLRTGSRQVWEAGYNADVNFRAFAERLQSIGEA